MIGIESIPATWFWGGCGAAVVWIAYWLWDRKREKVFCREKTFSIRKPFPLIGTPDLVMQEKGGQLSVHDLKTRNRPALYESDKIQLSLYRLLLERATGRRVSEFGVIRVRGPQGEKMLRVKLLPAADLEALYLRYMDLAEGSGGCAKYANNRKLCEFCGFKGKECFPPNPPERKTKAR